MSETGLRVDPPAPTLGQHTDEILSEIGMSVGEIDRLRSEGVI